MHLILIEFVGDLYYIYAFICVSKKSIGSWDGEAPNKAYL
jgi:hypothetical protein